MRTRLLSFVVLFSLSTSLVFAQGKATRKDSERWQQHANYFMEIDMDVNTNRFQGTQKIKYTNNSPDVLDQVFYHLCIKLLIENKDLQTQNIAI